MTSTISAFRHLPVPSGRLPATARLGLMSLLLCSIPAGCATSPISKPLRLATRNQPSFTELSEHPDAYKSRMVRLGGTVVKTNNLPRTTEIEVVQKPLSRSDHPEETDQSFGRFLVRCQGFLDSAVYAKGREITVAGEVQGHEVRPLDQIQYAYPVIGCKEIHLWPIHPPLYFWYDPWGPSYYPGYYHPYYYPYWYPYW